MMFTINWPEPTVNIVCFQRRSEEGFARGILPSNRSSVVLRVLFLVRPSESEPSFVSGNLCVWISWCAHRDLNRRFGSDFCVCTRKQNKSLDKAVSGVNDAVDNLKRALEDLGR